MKNAYIQVVIGQPILTEAPVFHSIEALQDAMIALEYLQMPVNFGKVESNVDNGNVNLNKL